MAEEPKLFPTQSFSIHIIDYPFIKAFWKVLSGPYLQFLISSSKGDISTDSKD